MLTRAEYEATDGPAELAPELIRQAVAARPREALRERIRAAMYLASS
jgi:hypothetical protein